MAYLDDPIAEVYRIREEILSEYKTVKEYNDYLRSKSSQVEKDGFRFLTEAEMQSLR